MDAEDGHGVIGIMLDFQHVQIDCEVQHTGVVPEFNMLDRFWRLEDARNVCG